MIRPATMHQARCCSGTWSIRIADCPQGQEITDRGNWLRERVRAIRVALPWWCRNWQEAVRKLHPHFGTNTLRSRSCGEPNGARVNLCAGPSSGQGTDDRTCWKLVPGRPEVAGRDIRGHVHGDTAVGNRSISVVGIDRPPLQLVTLVVDTQCTALDRRQHEARQHRQYRRCGGTQQPRSEASCNAPTERTAKSSRSSCARRSTLCPSRA